MTTLQIESGNDRMNIERYGDAISIYINEGNRLSEVGITLDADQAEEAAAELYALAARLRLNQTTQQAAQSAIERVAYLEGVLELVRSKVGEGQLDAALVEIEETLPTLKKGGAA